MRRGLKAVHVGPEQTGVLLGLAYLFVSLTARLWKAGCL